jgi:hypothetical protein
MLQEEKKLVPPLRTILTYRLPSKKYVLLYSGLCIIPGSEVFLEKLIIHTTLKKFPTFYGTESIPYQVGKFQPLILDFM